MQTKSLIKEFDKLQAIYGDNTLDAIYGAGQINNPKTCLVFMNPTGRNITANKKWLGLKAPWIGTKNVWRMFFRLGFFDETFLNEINDKSPTEWDYQFAENVYSEVSNNSMYITNLSKATQVDARPLKNDVFRKYLSLFREEIGIVKPKIIITFGNQVSSIVLDKQVKVSDYRKQYEEIDINGNIFKVFPVYYPVGQGMRNIKKAEEDINWIMKTQI
jgi:uracil-DNA glycosylase